MQNKFFCHYYNTSPRGFVDSGSSTMTLLDEFRRIALLRSDKYVTHDEVVRLPLDQNIFETVNRMAEAYHTTQLKFIIVIGIGGSNLGTKAVYDALRGQCDFLSETLPKMVFLDTVGVSLIRDLEKILGDNVHYKEEILINLVSKSGATTESIVNFEVLMAYLMERIDDVESRVVCTTDEDSNLWNLAKQKHYGLLAIPKMIGGRFSVFSAVGLFPLVVSGIDIVSLRQGAADMLALCIGGDSGNQHARRAAEILFGEMMAGTSMLNIFHFTPELESLGKWERQLIAESLGKEKDISGKVVHAGITPIVSIGSTDLHSMAQLYFGGPRDKFTMLIKTENTFPIKIPNDGLFDGLVSGIAGKITEDIMGAIYQGVMGAYRKNALPFAEVGLSTLSPHTIGAYMQWRILTVIHLAMLMHVNPYDQPSVEDYKEGTRRTLQNLHN